MIRWLILLGWCTFTYASPEEGQKRVGEILDLPRVQETLNSPNYQAGADRVENMKYEIETEKHKRWQQHQALEARDLEKVGAKQGVLEKVGEQIIQANKTRPRFDEIEDLKLIEESEQYTTVAEKELLSDGTRKRDGIREKTEIKTCQQARQAEEYQCIRYLEDPTVKVTPAKYSNYWCSAGNHSPDDPRCGAKTYYSVPRKYREKVVEVSPDNWVSDCHSLEMRQKNNECDLIKEECIDSKPRVIEGEMIHKPCWKFQRTYECRYPVQVSCKPLLKLGCSPLNSKCLFYEKDKCYIWEQKYQCPISQEKLDRVAEYLRPFCLEGECFNEDYEPNQEMASALTQLDIFRKMQNDVRSDGLNTIFKGTTQGCNKICLGIKNCCKISGWAMDLKMADCSPEEKRLAENRQKGLCVEVGTFCAERAPITKTCIRKKTHFCCFSSKLTKAVQEQGRRQLGFHFGEDKHPNCRGLTPEELSKIDFSALDLREAFSDLRPKGIDQGTVERKLQNSLQALQQDFKSQTRGEK